MDPRQKRSRHKGFYLLDNMKKFFLSHPDVVLAVTAFVLLAVLIGFFSWGINDVVFEIQRSAVSSNASTGGGFDLKDASKLDLRGVSTSTSPSAITPTTDTVTVSTSTPATSTSTATSSSL